MPGAGAPTGKLKTDLRSYHIEGQRHKVTEVAVIRWDPENPPQALGQEQARSVVEAGEALQPRHPSSCLIHFCALLQPCPRECCSLEAYSLLHGTGPQDSSGGPPDQLAQEP